jgi:exoribonuclease R
MKTCIHGDQVLAQPLGADRKGRREARIVRVLVPKTSQIVAATLPMRALASWCRTTAA